ncbi:2-phospho-L-lactate guanylyltransferase [Sphingobium aromaticiconvertens]|uniref:2-phospho-L-lactate guanylyltransferase n=1 Tax=Sphingobium aromaticiconvertens TaxID=365341 RepID=UPI00301596E8
MRWTAVAPLKLGPDRKSRLSPHMSLIERIALGNHMAAHVLAQLHRVQTIEKILILAPENVAVSGEHWVRDEGRGLNAELEALLPRLEYPMLVIHADLPFLESADIEHLLARAEEAGSALAPDLHGRGTNAIALAKYQPQFAFAFGPESFARHRRVLGRDVAIVNRVSLSRDLDTKADLDYARVNGLPI